MQDFEPIPVLVCREACLPPSEVKPYKEYLYGLLETVKKQDDCECTREKLDVDRNMIAQRFEDYG